MVVYLTLYQGDGKPIKFTDVARLVLKDKKYLIVLDENRFFTYYEYKVSSIICR